MDQYYTFLWKNGSTTDPESILRKKTTRGKRNGNFFPFSCEKVPGLYKKIDSTNDIFNDYIESQEQRTLERELGIVVPNKGANLVEKKRSEAKIKAKLERKKEKERKEEANRRLKQKSKHSDNYVPFVEDFHSLLYKIEAVSQNKQNKLKKKKKQPLNIEEKIAPPVPLTRSLPPQTKMSGNVAVPEYRNGEKVKASGFTKSETTAMREQHLATKKSRRQRFKEGQKERRLMRTESGENVSLKEFSFPNLLDQVGDKLQGLSDGIGEKIDAKELTSKIEKFLEFVQSDVNFSFYLRLFNLFYQIYRGRNVADYLSAVYAYTSEKIDSLVDFSFEALKGLVVKNLHLFLKWSKSPMKTEAGGSPSALMTTVIGSQLFVVIRDFAISTASIQWFGRDYATWVFKSVGNQDSSFLNLSVSIVDGFSKLCLMGRNWINGMSFNDAFLSPDPFLSIVNTSTELLRYKDFLYSGLPVEGYRDKVSYCKELGESINVFKRLSEYVSPTSPHYKNFMKTKMECEMTYCAINAETAAKNRIAPPFLILYGPPGTGKSHLLQYVCVIWSEVKGRKFDPTHVYSKTDPKYWEQHSPQEQPIIHFSELGNLSQTMVEKLGDLQITEILSLVDTLPYCLPMAFGKKGTVYADPELVVGDANNETAHVERLFHCPGAVLRRMLHVEMTVFPRFRKVNSYEIDPLKACAEGGHSLDRYAFSIYNLSFDKGKKVRKYIVKEVRLDEFTDALRQYFINRLRTSAKSAEAMSDLQSYNPSIHGPMVNIEPEENKSWRIKSETGETKPIIGDVFDDNDQNDAKLAEIERVEGKLKKQGVVETPNISDFPKIGGVNQNDFKKVDLPDPEDRKACVKFSVKQLVVLVFNFCWQFIFLKLFTVDGLFDFCGLRFNVWWSMFYYFIYALIGAPFSVITLLTYMTLTSSGFFYKFVVRLIFRQVINNVKELYEDTTRSLTLRGEFKFFDKFTFKKKDLDTLSRLGAILAGFYIALKIVKSYRQTPKDKEEEREEISHKESIRSQMGEYLSVLKSVESERFGAGFDMKRIPNKRIKIWGNQVDASIPTFTGSIEDFTTCVRKNTRYCVFPVDGVNKDFYVLGIKNNYMILNTHCLAGKTEGILYMSNTDGYHLTTGTDPKNLECQTGWFPITFDSTNLYDMGEDLTMISASSKRFRDISKHFPATKYGGKGSAFFADRSTYVTASYGVEAVDSVLGQYTIGDHVVYEYPGHRPGLCGLPVIAEIGSGYSIIAIHFGGDDFSDDCAGRSLTSTELLSAVEKCPTIFRMTSQSRITQIKFEEPSPKSMTRYEILHNLDYFGKTPGNTILDSSSRLTRSKIGPKVASFFKETHNLVGSPFGKPMMRAMEIDGIYYSPYAKCMRNIAKPKKALKPKILSKIVEVLSKRFIDGLTDVPNISPLTCEQAINGVEGDAFIRRINASASAGFGYSGAKSNYLPLVDENGTRIASESLAEDILKCIATYKSGESCRFVYTAKLKDEPRSLKKCMDGSTRVFFMGPLDSLVLARMFTMPFYTFMVERGDVFCTAVGIDMHRASQELYDKIVSFSPYIMEGDYGAYDQCMPLGVANAVNEIILRVLEAKGYNEEALEITRAILSDSMFPLIEILKDVFEAPGLQPSGKFATAEDNSLRGLVLLMYAWYDQDFYAKHGDFFDNVMVITYGDDLLASSKVLDFNCKFYSAYVRKNYGMTFTSSDKKDIDYSFIESKDMSFLKRNFVFHPEFGRIMCPLGHSSIIRALTWNLPSRSMSESEQVLSTCTSMIWEYAIFSPSTFDSFRTFLIGAVHTEYGIPIKEIVRNFPTFVEIKASILGLEDSLPDLHTDEEKITPTCLSQDVVFRTQVNSTASGSSELYRIAKTKDTIFKMLLEYEEERRSLIRSLDECKEIQNLMLSDVRATDVVRNIDPAIEAKYIDLLYRLEDVCATISRLRDLATPNHRFTTQSGELSSGTVDFEVKTENFTDITGGNVMDESAGFSVYPKVGQEEILKIDDFWARPLELATFDLALGVHESREYNIWDIWSRNPSIRAKLRNYAFFSGDLHVRTTISASPMHSGRVLLSYQPLASSNETLDIMRTALTTYPTMRNMWLNYHSQAPGAVSMDIKANIPVDIQCPYINVSPACRLFNGDTVISDVTAFADLLPLGRFYFNTINTVACESATPTTVRVQLVIWASNVKLGCPTGTQLVVTTESGKSEFEIGPVEKWSTRAAMVAGALVTVPEIGPFAYASQQMFSGLGYLASLFGWSKPPVIDEPVLVKHMPFQNGCQVIGYDTTMRLTLDPKQELTIDPRVVGIEVDDMTIAGIAQRMSFFDSFTWDDSDATMVPMYYVRNSPRIETVDVGTLKTFKQPTAAAFATTPFAWWNGKHRYRLEVVGSIFKRGKIAIFFEPNIPQSGLINLNLSTNKQSMIVIDIQETQVIEFCVGWAQPRQWCSVPYTGIKEYGSTLGVTEPESCNGYICIAPFTKLQSTDGSPVKINMYSCIDELQVNVLTDNWCYSTRRAIRTESGVSCVEEVSCVQLNYSSAELKDASARHFGELPISFRSLLKRFANTYRAATSATASVGRIRIVNNNVPNNILPYGTTTPLDHVDLFSYLRYAFVGLRGSVRKRLQLINKVQFAPQNQVHVTHKAPSNAGLTPYQAFETGKYGIDNISGTVTFAWNVNSGIEFEMPYYSPNLFTVSFADDSVGAVGGMMLAWSRGYIMDIDVTENHTAGVYNESSAAGEDFCFLRFQGAPYYTT